jgi:hypothetical protein
MGPSESPGRKTLVCGGCGKRFRISASADRTGLTCRDCGSPLRLVRDAAATGEEKAPREKHRPVRRKKSPIPILIALGVSAVLLIIAAMIFNRVDMFKAEEEEDSSELSDESQERLNALKRLEVNRRDPFEDKLDRMVEVLHQYKIDRFPLYLESAAIYEFRQGDRKGRTGAAAKRWKDLSTTERFKYQDRLRMQVPFSGRWRLAKLGDRRTVSADDLGLLDHRWVVVPRTFPNGETDEVWLLVKKDRGRPRICGYRHRVIEAAKVVKAEPDAVEAPDISNQEGFQKLDPGLKKAPLPATTADGAIDETGAPTSPIQPVKLIEGTSSSDVATIRTHIATLVDPDKTREARQALKELVFLGKPAVPVLLNALVGKDLRNPADVYHCHQVVQALRDITAKRFGFEPQTGQDILTAATAIEQQSALRRWFGWWRLNGKTFEPVLTPQLKKELEKRKRRRERFGK